MRRQHQHIVRHGSAHLVERGQPVLHRIGIGLGREHRYIGGNARQHLVAGHQQLQRRAVQAGMFGRVAGADDDLPVVRANTDGVAIGQAVEALGQGVDVLAEAAEAGAVHLDRFVVPACAAIELDRVIGRRAPRIRRQHAAHQVFQPRHPQLAVELAGQPPGHADVVGVHMGHEQARQATGERAACGEQGAPGLGGFRRLQAGVDGGPAIAVADGPQVDVVQAQRHRHAQPQDTGRYLAGVAGFGGVTTGVIKLGLFEGDGGSCEGDVGGLGAHRCLGRWAGRAVRGGRCGNAPAPRVLDSRHLSPDGRFMLRAPCPRSVVWNSGGLSGRRRQHLARVEQVQRIKRLLHLPHQLQFHR
ncbi:hypothetical protein D9M68_195560 [compost metagenome]